VIALGEPSMALVDPAARWGHVRTIDELAGANSIAGGAAHRQHDDGYNQKRYYELQMNSPRDCHGPLLECTWSICPPQMDGILPVLFKTGCELPLR